MCKCEESIEVDNNNNRLIEARIDHLSIHSRTNNNEQEYKVAISDLLAQNNFLVVGFERGPYRLHLLHEHNRLLFEIFDEGGFFVCKNYISIRPFRKVISEYFVLCESYADAIKTSAPSEIQLTEVGRRNVHDEGAARLQNCLSEIVKIDQSTARKLFTLLFLLYSKFPQVP